MNIKRELAKNSMIVIWGNIGNKLLLMIASLVYGSLLGAAAYGQFSYAVSILSFIVVFGCFGFESGLEAFIPIYQDKEKKNNIISLSFILVLATNIILCALAFLVNNIYIKSLENYSDFVQLFNLLIPSILLLNLFNLMKGIFKSLKDVVSFTFGSYILKPGIQLALFLILFLGIQNKMFAVVYAYLAALIIVLAFFAFRLKALNIKISVSKQYYTEFIRVVKYCSPLLFSSIILILTHNIDIVMLGSLRAMDEVGVYKMALSISAVISFGLNSVLTIYPALARKLYHNNDIKELKQFTKYTTKWVFLISLLLFSIFVVLSKDIMALLGEEYIKGGYVLLIVSGGHLVNSLAGPIGKLNTMTNNAKANFGAFAIAVIVNIILNALLIPQFGMYGAGIASAVSFAVSNILRVLIAYRKLKFIPLSLDMIKGLLPFTVAVGTGIIINFFLNVNSIIFRLIIVSICIGIAFVLITWYFVLSESDKEKIVNIMKNKLKAKE